MHAGSVFLLGSERQICECDRVKIIVGESDETKTKAA